jgi:Nucleotidyl transferase AbiEii toxin, Type IV TA system
MPVSELHRRVATIALAAAAGHGFALAGGNALLAHGLTDRYTADVDLFTDQEAGVAAAAEAVETALAAAGFHTGRHDKTGGLADIFYGLGEGLAEWVITAPGGEQVLLQLAYYERGRSPVRTDLGPVLDLEDALGAKVCALASRVEPRDYIDVAAALGRYSPAQLIGFAIRIDQGLTGQDFAEAGQRVDEFTDEEFADYGLSPHDVSTLRKRFAGWPRA